MAIHAGAIALDLGLNTAPLSTQIKGAAAGAQTQLNGAFKGVSAQASKTAGGIGAKFTSLFAKLGGLMTAAFAFGRIKAMAQEWMRFYQTQIESEVKIAVTMRNATNATLKEIQAVKDLASEYQQLGVLGDEVQLAGMQELATYVKNVESVKKLMPVLNDMVTQQYGYDATGGSAVSLATMIGKVMTGSTTALQRYGYDFTDEQAGIIKYGTEAERVATVTDVIEESVRNMNEALAQTPTGKMKQLSNNFGDMKEALGRGEANMYNITKECYDALCQPSRKLTVKAVMTLADGSLCRLSASDFKQGGIRLSEATSGAGSFDLGAAIMSRLTLTLNNFSGRYSGMRFIGGQVSVIQIGVTLTDNSTEWVPLGVFDIESVKYSGTAAEIVAYDFLSRADRELPAVTCPVTLGNLLRTVCIHCGIPWNGDRFLHEDYVVSSLPQTATCRDVISYIAQMAGCYARMTRDGALRLGWYGYDNMPPWGAEDWPDGGMFVEMTSGDEADGGDFFSYDDPDIDGGQNDKRGLCRIFHPKSVQGDQPLTITGIRYVAEDEEDIEVAGNGGEIIRAVPGQSYLCGTEEYVFDVSDNPLLTHDISAVLAAIGEKLIGDSFSPLTLSCMSNPALEAGDIVTAADRRGHTYTAFINRLEYKFGAPITLSCEAQSAAEVRAVHYGAVSRLEKRLRTDTENKLNAYQQRVQTLNNLMLNAMGVYKSAIQNGDGSITYYTHDKPTLEASSYISCETSNGFAYTNSGWNDGSPVWQYGMTADGNIICHVLSAVGIVADWIQAGRIESADGSCYFDLDNNQLFANKIGLPKRYLSAGEIITDSGESRAGIACHDEELSNNAYFQLRPVKATADNALYGFGLFDQMGRGQVICTSRSDHAEDNSVFLYGYDASGNRHALLTVSAVVGGVRLSSMSGQNRIVVTDSGISIYKNGAIVQSW